MLEIRVRAHVRACSDAPDAANAGTITTKAAARAVGVAGFRLLARRTGRRHDARGLPEARNHGRAEYVGRARVEECRDFEAKIVAYFEHPYTNAVLKGADNVIQNVKRRARGFRNIDYFATMIYLTCGKLDLKAVTTT